jgi:hypothetical protein
MSKLVDNEVKLADEFRDKIETFILGKGQCPTGDRNTPLVAYWSLVFEFHRGILRLISNELYGAAFALVRPIVEAVVRAHVVLMCSEEELKKLANDEYRTNLQTVGKEIDTNFGTDSFFENFLKSARPALHSYTHAGALQLGRRFHGTNLAPNYSDEEILEAIHVSTSAVFMVNNLTTKHLGFEQEWELNTEHFGAWSAASTTLPLALPASGHPESAVK